MRLPSLPRLWVRQILKVLFGLLVLSLTVLLVDQYYSILPPSYQSRLTFTQPDHLVVDIKIESCVLKSRCPANGVDGWYKIPKELGLGTRWSKSSFVYVKRVSKDKLSLEDKVVVDATIADSKAYGNMLPPYVLSDVSPGTDEEPAANIQPSDISKHGWKKKKNGLWIKYGSSRSTNAVTAGDVLFGSDAKDPRLSWQLRDGYIDGLSTEPRLSLRIGPRQEKPEVTLRVQKSGNFKVMQIADLHFSTGPGKCLDPYPEEPTDCKADAWTLEYLTKVLDDEKPDFIALTGDQIFGQAAPDSETAMLKVVAPLIERKIPYAMVFGNHDHEGSLSRKDLMEFVSLLPYSLSQSGPADVSGIGNYVLQVLGSKSHDPALTFYFLDSHAYSTNPKLYPGYDWIKEDQLKYLEDTYTSLKPAQDEYSHIHMSMAFFHIPVPEYRTEGMKYMGEYREGCTAPRFNTGARQVLAKIGVKVLTVGHDHANNFCMDNRVEGQPDMYLCYGGGAGEGGYGGYGGVVRGVRVFDINTQRASIASYKLLRNATDVKIGEQILVNSGEHVRMD